MKEDEAKSFIHRVFSRVNITVEEQLEQRRKEIASGKDCWELSMILLVQSLFLLVVNGVILLISWRLAVPVLLLSVAVVIFLGYRHFSLRSLLTAWVTGCDDVERRVTHRGPLKNFLINWELDFLLDGFSSSLWPVFLDIRVNLLCISCWFPWDWQDRNSYHWIPTREFRLSFIIARSRHHWCCCFHFSYFYHSYRQSSFLSF